MAAAHVDDAVYFGVAFASAGMDFISTSRGGKFDDAKQPAVGGAAYPYTGPSGYECMPQFISDEHGPFGRNVDADRRRSAERSMPPDCETPVVCTGGIHNFELAEDCSPTASATLSARRGSRSPIRTGSAKLALGLGATRATCEFTNYCEGLDQKHKPSPASSGTRRILPIRR